MEQETVSIIVPVYNAEKYLEACLDSILAQTYKELEIILVDDGATDSSPTICERYAKKDARIRLIHQENQGLSGARNTGLDAMTSSYVMFCDSDDEMSPTMVEELYRALIETSSDIAMCNPSWLKDNQDFTPYGTGSKTIFEGSYRFHILGRSGIGPMVQWNKLFKRYIFDNLRYPVGRYHEDEWIIHRELGAAKRVVWLDRTLYLYFLHTSSITHTQTAKNKIDAFEGFCDRIDYFQEQGQIVARNAAYQTAEKYIIQAVRHRSEPEIRECLFDLPKRYPFGPKLRNSKQKLAYKIAEYMPQKVHLIAWKALRAVSQTWNEMTHRS